MEKIYKEDVLELINDNIDVPVNAREEVIEEVVSWLLTEEDMDNGDK